jgi:histidinol-phosphatase (PHP family)
MERTCARAAGLGLPSVAFTEHADFVEWACGPGAIAHVPHRLRAGVTPESLFRPPALDAGGYLECVLRCRDRFPGLRILSGVEMGEPHWFGGQAGALLAAGGFDRVLGSLHSLAVGGGYRMVDDLYGEWPAGKVMGEYLAEALRLAESDAPFAVLAHIDYPVRTWPRRAGAFDPGVFEEQYRAVLAALAGSGRALEFNTRVPLHPQILRWWYQCGGEAVCFGSDAHEPSAVARGFADAAAMAEACGFRPGRHPHDLWFQWMR